MPGEQEHWLVIGATMTAFGIASARPQKTTLIETGPAPAPEFAGAFTPGAGGDDAAPVSHPGRELEKELLERGILADGRYHLPALVPVLMQRILKDRLECLFWTDLLAVSPGAGAASHSAVIFNASGKRKLPFARILDTRAETPAWPAPRRWTGKSLRALLHGRVAPDADPEELARLAWRPGRFETESTLGLAVDPETGFPEARRRLLAAWRQRPAALANVRIAALATEFQYDCPTEPVSPAPGLLHVPSAGFANPIAAFDAGAALAMEISS